MLISTANINGREMFKSSMSRKRRYASFIGSTNNMHPILDHTGSRRFICVPVSGPIDFTTPVDYKKLYGQLVAELRSGARYYFNDTDNQRIMDYNLHFKKITDLKEMILCKFRKPVDENEGILMNISDISDILKTEFVNYTQSRSANYTLGRALSELGFQKKHTNGGNKYVVVCV